MGLNPQEERTLALQSVTERLNNYEKEQAGISINEAEVVVGSIFPEDEIDLDGLFETLVTAVSTFTSEQDSEICTKELSTALCATLAIMKRLEADSFAPYLILWAKYLNNSVRFSMLHLSRRNLVDEDYGRVLKESKKRAESSGWSDLEALRQIMDYYFCDGWYYYPEQSQYFPKPMGSTDLGMYQLVTEHFLLSMPHEFTVKELFVLLMGEIGELEAELMDARPFRSRVKDSFEAADVFIYLTHIASKLGLSISELIVACKKGAQLK